MPDTLEKCRAVLMVIFPEQGRSGISPLKATDCAVVQDYKKNGSPLENIVLLMLQRVRMVQLLG